LKTFLTKPSLVCPSPVDYGGFTPRGGLKILSLKQYHEPIQVEVNDDGLPYSFRWRNRAWNVISVTDRWVLQAGWWRSDGTEKRDYVLVDAEGMGGATAVELYLGVDSWILGRVMH